MTAKEMFEALGYICVQDSKAWIKYYDKYGRGKIIFYKNSRTYSAKRESASVVLVLDVKHHEAITQQMKELGWL